MKIISIVGTRPQFVKLSVMCRQFEKHNNIEHVIIHTGQHYDFQMNESFFIEFNLPKPNYTFNHEYNTKEPIARYINMQIFIAGILAKEKPSVILVYGDCDTTLAGAISGFKMNIPVCHIEAGVRSFNRIMQEEKNRILTDEISIINFAPTVDSYEFLCKHHKHSYNIMVGDLMYELFLSYKDKIKSCEYLSNDLPDTFHFATIHRAENDDDFHSIIRGFELLDYPVVIPIHPRNKERFNKHKHLGNVIGISPLSYIATLQHIYKCKYVFTDSGGLQKEAYMLEKQCKTLRDCTEWRDTLTDGWNRLVGVNVESIVTSEHDAKPSGKTTPIFGFGNTSSLIVDTLLKHYK